MKYMAYVISYCGLVVRLLMHSLLFYPPPSLRKGRGKKVSDFRNGSLTGRIYSGVNEKQAAAISEYKSQRYYSCGVSCKCTFAWEPEKYLGKGKK